MRVAFGPHGVLPLTEAERARRAVADHLVAGLVVVTLKYVIVILRADNRGEGGILALLAAGAAHLVAARPATSWWCWP